MTSNAMYDVIIIGAGPGGLAASIYAQRAAMKTAIFELGAPGGQMNISAEVENYPGFKQILGADLSKTLLEHAMSYGINVTNQEVAAVKPGLEHHEVHTANGSIYKTHAVILATGGSPRKLEIPGERKYSGRGVSYCAVCDGFFFQDRIVTVVGGGDSAVEEALYLSKIAKKVYLVHRRDELRAGGILQQRILGDCNVEILWNSIATAVNADDIGVTSVDLKDTQTGAERNLVTDGVFIFIGFIPNNNLVPAGTKLNADGYVVTDEKCETNIPGIFAIGDLREKYARQIVLAVADGCTSALAAAHFVETRKTEIECQSPEFASG